MGLGPVTQDSVSQAGRWYVVRTKPRQEFGVQELLEQRGIRTYLPCLPQTGKAGKTNRRPTPFFGLYLFAQVDWTRVSLSSINWAHGVSSVVCFGGAPAEVDERIIAWLQDRLERLDGQEYYQGQRLRSGDQLEITGGPFKGLEAIFEERLSSADRARVLIDMLGRLTPCEIDLRFVRPA